MKCEALRSGLRSSPRTQSRHQMGFNIFDFRTSWIPPWVQDLLLKYPWIPTKISKKINEIQVTKIKTYARFLLKSCFGDIVDKITANCVNNSNLQILLCWILIYPIAGTTRILILKYCIYQSNVQYWFLVLAFIRCEYCYVNFNSYF